MARAAGCHTSGASPSSGSTTMRGLLGGILAARLGFPMFGDYERLIGHAEARCTHEYFVPVDEGSDEVHEFAGDQTNADVKFKV